MRMQGNTVLVAGGGSGIGRGLAELLQSLGNEVLVLGRPAPGEAATGLRFVDIDLADPWSVAGFSEQIAAICPALNLFVDIAIAFPVGQLPGMQALLDDEDQARRAEARRLGMQQLVGTLLPHFRKREHSAVMTVSLGPALMPPQATVSAGLRAEGGLRACTLSVRRRWARASIEAIDIALASRAGPPAGGAAMPRAEFIASLARLLAESPQEEAALARLRALAPAARPLARAEARDDDLVPEAY